MGATLYFTAERGSTTRVIGSGWDQYNLIEATGSLAGAAERDLIARSGDGTLWMYMCRTDGTMTARVHIGTGWNVMDQVLAPGDVTGDGKTDVLARDGAGTLWVYPGTGSQTADAVLGARASAGTGWGSYTALWSTGDNTGDGKSDLLAADSAGALWLFPGTGSSNAPFAARTQVGTGFTFISQRGPSLPTGSAGEATSRARWADFDGDGRADSITIDPSGPVRVFANRGGDGHGGWLDLGRAAAGGTTDASRVRFADFDGDGRADYIVLNTDGSVHAWLNKGGDNRGGWTDLGVVASGTTTDVSRVRFADFDGDHKDDYWRINADGSVDVWLNKGGGSWSAQGTVASGTTTDIARLRLADFDGDRKDDYWRINADGSVDLWLNKGGGSWSAQGTVASGTTTVADQVRMADFDADGKADFYTVGTDKSATVHLNHGANTWASLGLVVAPV